jgi:hypothetical protein
MVVPLNYSKEPVLLMLLEMRHITFWLLLLLLAESSHQTLM